MMNSHNKVPVVTGAGSGHVASSLTHKAEPRIIRLRKMDFYPVTYVVLHSFIVLGLANLCLDVSYLLVVLDHGFS